MKKQGETAVQKLAKKLPEDEKHLAPEILISNSSTSTVKKKTISIHNF